MRPYSNPSHRLRWYSVLRSLVVVYFLRSVGRHPWHNIDQEVIHLAFPYSSVQVLPLQRSPSISFRVPPCPKGQIFDEKFACLAH